MAGFTSSGRRLRGRRTTGTKKASNTAKRALKLALHNRDTKGALDTVLATLFTASKVLNIKYIQPSNLGDKCTFQKIEGRIWITQHPSSTVSDSWRCDLILDRQPNGVVLSPLLAYTSATPNITALIAFGQTERYKIARSWSGSFNDGTGGLTARNITFSYRTGLISEGNGSLTQANVTKNAYYFVFWTESATNLPTMTYHINTFSTD